MDITNKHMLKNIDFQIILSTIVWILFLISLIRTCFVYPTLSNDIGVHFSGSGDFDVISNKKYVFYPHLISLITLLLCECFSYIAGKLKLGLKLTDEYEHKLRMIVKLYLQIFKICVLTIFSGIWTDCVIKQQNLNMIVVSTVIYVWLLATIVFFSVVIIIGIIGKKGTTLKRPF